MSEDLSHLGLTLVLAHIGNDKTVQMKRESGSPWVLLDVVEPFSVGEPTVPGVLGVQRMTASFAIWKQTGDVYIVDSDGAVRDDPFLKPEGHTIPFQTTPNVRPEVAWFAAEMEKRLRENDHKPGWKSDTPASLVERVEGEAQELYDALNSKSDAEMVREAADVANFAMMVADRMTDGEEKVAPPNMRDLIAWFVEAYDDSDDAEFLAALALTRRAFDLPPAPAEE